MKAMGSCPETYLCHRGFLVRQSCCFLGCPLESTVSRVCVISQSRYTVIAMLWSCVMARDVWYPCVVLSIS